jgi:tetratricopeptide (TPR) repeat protein
MKTLTRGMIIMFLGFTFAMGTSADNERWQKEVEHLSKDIEDKIAYEKCQKELRKELKRLLPRGKPKKGGDIGPYSQIVSKYGCYEDVSMSPDDDYKRRGYAYFALGEYEKAIKDYDTAIKLDPNIREYYKERGYVYYAMGEYEKAVIDYNTAIKLAPKDDYTYDDRAFIRLFMGDAKGALDDAEKGYKYHNNRMTLEVLSAVLKCIEAIKLNPKDAAAYNRRALIYEKYYPSIHSVRLNTLKDHDKAIALEPENAQFYFDRASFHEGADEYGKAAADFAQAIKLKPDFTDAHLSLGVVRFSLGEYEKSLAHYHAVIKLNPKYDLAYYDRAFSFVKLERYDDAMADYNMAIELNPNYAEAYNLRALLHKIAGRYDDAIKDLAKAIEVKPQNGAAYYNRALIYKNLGVYEKAADDFTHAVKHDSSLRDIRFYQRRAFVYMQLGKYEDAKSNYHQALHLASDKALYSFLCKAYAAAESKLGEFGDAVEYYKKAVESQPNDPAARYFKDYFNSNAILSFKANEKYAFSFNSRAGAYNSLEDAMKDDKGRMKRLFAPEENPNNASYYLELAKTSAEIASQEDYKESVKLFSAHLKTNPNDAQAYFGRANAYKYARDTARDYLEDLNSYEQAIKDYDAAIALNPKFAAAYYHRALTYERLGRYEKAIDDYIKAIDLDASVADIYNERKKNSVVFGDNANPNKLANYVDTVKLHTNALKTNPQDAKTYESRAKAHLEYGELTKAAADLTMAIKYAPQNSDIYSARAFSYVLFGEYEKTIEDFTQAINLTPNADNYINRANAYAVLGEYEKAMKDYDAAAKLAPENVYIQAQRANVEEISK